MRISAFSQINNFKIQNTKQQKHQTKTIQKEALIYPTTSQYLAFMGGYTLDLAKTYKQLNPEQYPSDIREKIAETLEIGNPENKTLNDVHFEKYKGILDCFTLDELKEQYPEFKGVSSAYEINAKTNSFIDKFQHDELALFPYGEDLTLQLIKLYWGQGFSLNDLSDYIASNNDENKGLNLHYTLKKLNIPTMNSHYASVLKLSNKEYNEKFTSELSIKLLEAKEERKQREEGEAVIIPSRKLSQAHREHISQGLKNYYKEHPEKIYDMSKRQKDFYEQNPDKKEELSDIMLYAWNQTQEGKSIKKHLSKYMKKFQALTDEQLALKEKMTPQQQVAFASFWKRNVWAQKQLAIAVKKGYAAIDEILADKKSWKTIPGEKIVYSAMPIQIQKEIIAWAKENGYDTTNLPMGSGMIYKDEENYGTKREQALLKKGQKIFNAYIAKHPKATDRITTFRHFALVDIYEDILSMSPNVLKSLNNDVGKVNIMKYTFNSAQSRVGEVFSQLNGKRIPKEGTNIKAIEQIYSDLMLQALLMDTCDFAQYVNNKLNQAYIKYGEYVAK